MVAASSDQHESGVGGDRRGCPLLLAAGTPKARGGSQGHPGDGAGVDGNRRVERRRDGGSGESAMDVLTRLPAVVLERIPVPTFAVARDGVSPPV
jgi:hypothetical protein